MAKKQPASGTRALIAPAARPPAALTAEETYLSEKAIQTFAETFGGRDQLGEILAVAGAGSQAALLASLLLDPRYERVKLGTLCTQAGITIADLFTAVSKAQFARAHLLAHQKVAAYMVEVVEDVMRRATPYAIPCEACGGVGTKSPGGEPDAPPQVCKACNGSCQQLVLPELDRQKLALDLAKLLPKGNGGPLVAVQQNFGGDASGGMAGGRVPGGLEQLQQAVNDALFSRPGLLPAAPAIVVEGEIADSAPTGTP